MTNEIHWVFKPFKKLTLLELYDLLKLRTEVFVVEQNCVYQDMDDLDQEGIHLNGFLEDKLVAHCRIFPPDIIVSDQCNFGRVAVMPKYQKKGIGRVMMEQTLTFLKQKWPNGQTLIHAQYYLKAFYKSLGFEQCSDAYDEVGIPHINMIINHNKDI